MVEGSSIPRKIRCDAASHSLDFHPPRRLPPPERLPTTVFYNAPVKISRKALLILILISGPRVFFEKGISFFFPSPSEGIFAR